jgi:HEAT repeat protein
LRTDDIGAFGRWYDVEAERVLLAIVALEISPELRQEAFDTLAGKSLSIEPSASLVEWVRRNQWDNRSTFARSVGVLGNIAAFSDAELEDVFRSLDRYAEDPDFVDIMLESRHPRIARLVVKRYAGKLGLGGLINLLNNPDKEVRITAVRSLKDYNDIGALKFILDNYERERDEAVREAYRENFWVIKQREGGAAPSAPEDARSGGNR